MLYSGKSLGNQSKLCNKDSILKPLIHRQRVILRCPPIPPIPPSYPSSPPPFPLPPLLSPLPPAPSYPLPSPFPTPSTATFIQTPSAPRNPYSRYLIQYLQHTLTADQIKSRWIQRTPRLLPCGVYSLYGDSTSFILSYSILARTRRREGGREE